MAKRKITQKEKEKAADMALDVIKYVITAIILTTLFSDFVNWAWYWYVLTGSIMTALLWLCLSLYKDETEKKKGK